MCCSDVNVPPVPGPTAQETELQNLQLEQYKQSIAEEEALRAAIEAATGKPYAETMAGITKSSLDLNAAALERYQKAMAGELEIDPTLERSLTEQEQTVREAMLKQLGPGWETSTAGTDALAEYQKRAEELRHSARRGEITSAEQQGYALNPTSWLPGVVNTTQAVNANDLLAQYRASRLGQYGSELNAFNLQQAYQSDPWSQLLGLGRGAGAGALMGSAGMLGGAGAMGGAGLGALLAI